MFEVDFFDLSEGVGLGFEDAISEALRVASECFLIGDFVLVKYFMEKLVNLSAG